MRKLKIAMLYAFWEGEPWSTPLGLRRELISRYHEVTDWNLYHNNGILPKKGIRSYSNEAINELHRLITNGIYKPDVIFMLDYGPWDAQQYDRRWHPDVVWVFEAGDEPQSHRMQMPKAAKSDITLSPDKQCVDRYQQMGINAHWWTHHADTNIFKPYHDEVVKYDCVTTCGPRGNGTTDIIKRALGDAFFNERYFWGEDYGRVLNTGKMVFQCSQYKEVTRRVFEGMACGKMVITDRLPVETGMDDLFEDGHDIVYFDNAHDAIAKIKYYAANEEAREEIAANGFMKTVEQHSVKARIDEWERLVNIELEKKR